MRVAITHSAEIDLLEGFSFYEEQAAGIGDYFIDSLFADIDSLALFGGIHPKPEVLLPYVGQALSIRHLLRNGRRAGHR